MSWQDYKDTSTGDLLEYIKWKEQADYLEASKDAFQALFFRFRDDVVKKCRIVATNWGYDKDIGDEIAEQTFEKFWKNPHSFDATKCNTKDIDKCLRFYLYRIAQNQLANYKKQQEGPSNPYDGTEEIVIEFPDLDRMTISEDRKRDVRKMHDIIKAALDRLTPKHKIIYLTYKVHEKSGFKLPRHLSKSLREELDLTQNSIRFYKKEAFDIVYEYLKIYGNK